MAASLMECAEKDKKVLRKHLVTLCGGVLPTLNLRSGEAIPAGTALRIRNGRNIAKGMVSECQGGVSDYVVTVKISRGGQWLLDLVAYSGTHDPGVLSVNDFMTESQLSELLTEYESHTHTAR